MGDAVPAMAHVQQDIVAHSKGRYSPKVKWSSY